MNSTYLQEGYQPSEKDRKIHYKSQPFPHDCVGAIYMQSKLGEMALVGTGFLIASDLVLTVAHNIYSRKISREYQNLIFYPKVNGDIRLQKGYKVRQSRYNSQQFKKPSSENTYKYDYALIKLEEKVQGISKYIELGVNYVQQKEHLGIIGYRGNNQGANQTSLWWPNEHEVNDSLLRHKLSTVKGDSGSPLLVKRGKSIAVGIHFGDILGTGYNGGRTITDDVLCDLIRWEKEMSSQIKFHLMKNSTSQTQTIQTQQQLKSIKKKIGVYLVGINQPSFQKLKEELQKLKLISSPKVIISQQNKTQTSVKVAKQQLQNNNKLIEQPIYIPLPKKQDKHIQFKEYYLDDIVKKLQGMSLAEKQQITSLTLKSIIWNNLAVITL